MGGLWKFTKFTIQTPIDMFASGVAVGVRRSHGC